ncbi:MAG: tRNA (cytidine(34)-2'-O)-methyltransferase [Lachnospiraceae bacterium]|nr:tRNA (cytidine(34)-2'-O)-methyltransferase [Lachnospiraceae bacterium]
MKKEDFDRFVLENEESRENKFPHLNVVLLEPEIPANTGNIGRTCVATGTSLHLIKPLGFSIDEKAVRRAGMDYWKDIDLHVYENIGDFYAKNPGARVFYATTKGLNNYTGVEYKENDFIMFGKESAGIPEEVLVDHPEECIRIPMIGEMRSLNLSNSVAIVLYEALRQNDFCGLKMKGALHRLSWD